MDVKCFIGTVISVLKRDGVLEGGVKEVVKGNEVEVQRDSVSV